MPRSGIVLLASFGLAIAVLAGPDGVRPVRAETAGTSKDAGADKPAGAAPAVESPLSPAKALAAFHVDPGIAVELAAAEPLIESPVAVAFDARGRMFVVENRGYPTGPETAGRIAMLEDTNADGTFDHRTEFAEGLTYPNGMMAWREGLLVTCAPDLIYLADTDGDGRSDHREVLLTGFSTGGSTQLRASHPQLALDNWIYVTGGLTGGRVTSPKNLDHASVDFGRADLRFLADCSRFESVDGGGQFGMTFDDFGHRFICYNRVQVQHVVLPGRYLRRNPHLSATSTVQDCPADMVAEPLAGHGAAARLYPVSHNITTADSHAGTFTAACGVLVFRSSGLPEKYRGGVFSCDPTGNLVHFDTLEPAGATFVARQSAEPSEFLASVDDWFRPCNLAQGPDGALYVCDMYRKTIEHPDYLPPEIRKHTDFESGKGMGRIWRVRGANIKATELADRRQTLKEGSSRGTVDGLKSADTWRRETAHRLLLESRDKAVVPRLKALAADGRHGSGAVHALRLLDAFGALDTQLLAASLSDPTPGVREQAIELAEPRFATEPELVAKVAALAKDADPRVRFQCALALGESQDPAVIGPLVEIALAGDQDRWTRLAVLSSLGGRELEFLRQFAAARPPGGKGESAEKTSSGNSQLLGDLGQLIGASLPPADWASALHTAVAAVHARPFGEQAACIVGLSGALRLRRGGASGSALQAIIGKPKDGVTPDENAADRKFFDALFAEALKKAVDQTQPVELRSSAVSLLADADPAVVGEPLLALVGAHEPPAVQSSAVHALKNLEDPALAGRLLETERFRGYSPALRESVLAAMLSEPRLQAVLLSALEAGTIPVGMVDSLRRRQLTNHRDPALRERADKLFSTSAVGDRANVYADYKSVLELTGHAENGQKVFAKSCANCHRLDRVGTPVGPDLFGIRTQPKEAILLHVLIPEYEITPGFGAYLVETTDGRILAGLLVGETATQVTLRAALGREETVLRSDIESLALSKLSLMPQELEKSMSRQEMADLLAYLKGESTQ
ncbi:MAG TPA: PVC-type heme-binding CxxCH protein [Pirellulales bacterium]|nr:PVC-type heme-binding CxxCH protein [Pirellulales bacterium]